MAVTVSDAELVRLCNEYAYDVSKILDSIREQFPDYQVRPYRIVKRINGLREKGILPLDSGNYVSSGELLKGSSTFCHKTPQ